MKIKLGDLAKDRISGFTGIVVSKTKWLTGCDVIGLSPNELDSNGEPQKSQAFDVDRLTLVESGKAFKLGMTDHAKKDKVGGPSTLDQNLTKGSHK